MLTAVGGFAATSHNDTSVLALAIVGMLAAGADLSLPELLVVLLVGVLAVEIGAVSYGRTDLGTVLGYPATLAAVALAGRYQRVYRTQTEQAEALLAETRRAQFEAERAAALDERSRIAREIHDVARRTGPRRSATPTNTSSPSPLPSDGAAVSVAPRLVAGRSRAVSRPGRDRCRSRGRS